MTMRPAHVDFKSTARNFDDQEPGAGVAGKKADAAEGEAAASSTTEAKGGASVLFVRLHSSHTALAPAVAHHLPRETRVFRNQHPAQHGEIVLLRVVEAVVKRLGRVGDLPHVRGGLRQVICPS